MGLMQQLTRGVAFKISDKENKYLNSVLMYAFALVIFMIGMSYAGVPLYRMFCAVSPAVYGHSLVVVLLGVVPVKTSGGGCR